MIELGEVYSFLFPGLGLAGWLIFTDHFNVGGFDNGWYNVIYVSVKTSSIIETTFLHGTTNKWLNDGAIWKEKSPEVAEIIKLLYG